MGANFSTLFSIAAEYIVTQSNSTILIHHYWNSGQKLKVQNRIRNSDHMLPSHDSFYLFFLYNQEHLLMGNTMNRGLSPTTSIISQGKALTHIYTGKFVGSIFSVEVFSVQMTNCVKLTNKTTTKNM